MVRRARKSVLRYDLSAQRRHVRRLLNWTIECRFDGRVIMRFRWGFVFLMVLGQLPALQASARPAPWYKWQSITGDLVCAQTSPGEAWMRQEKAYVDARCQREERRGSLQ